MSRGKQYKITGQMDFNDLVVQQILFLPGGEASRVLYEMFPDEDINIILVDGDSYTISVGPVEVTITAD